MTEDKVRSQQQETRSGSEMLRELGFAWRRRKHEAAARSWRETVTHFKPEPWLVALEHERQRMPIRLRDLPTSSR